MPGSGVSSNYSSDSVTKTYEYLNSFKGGEAIFTFPPLPIKCPGAPQKIMYLADELFKRVNDDLGLQCMKNLAVFLYVEQCEGQNTYNL